MCQQCVDAVKEFYPDLPEDKYNDLLMGATAFPFGDAEIIRRQLKELKENTDGTIEGAFAYSHHQMEQARLDDMEATTTKD